MEFQGYMTKQTTITINGRLYDAITGMPVTASADKAHSLSPAAKRATPQPHTSAPARPPQKAFSDVAPRTSPTARSQPHRQPVAAKPAHSIHQHTQKSSTLYRKALQKPEAQPHGPLRPDSIARSPLISKFSAQPAATASSPQRRVEADTAPKVTPLHPVVAKALQKQAVAQQPISAPQPSSKQLKEMLIKERLAEVQEPQAAEHTTKRRPRLTTIIASTLSLLIIGGYLTYMNLPVISMKVAASRAGIAANFPEYKPDGYSLNGPIAYAPGEVIINYKSNSNDQAFKLTQQASSWDSQAVLDNYVAKQTDTYLTFQERGLTVYTFGSKAAWVNGGLLNTIEGDAALSSEQVLRVATSM